MFHWLALVVGCCAKHGRWSIAELEQAPVLLVVEAPDEPGKVRGAQVSLETQTQARASSTVDLGSGIALGCSWEHRTVTLSVRVPREAPSVLERATCSLGEVELRVVVDVRGDSHR